ncbi:MAG TPA: response regulator [Verrucomicrobiae bacterium]|jgi:CheY-like chemotaxis protein|nr:response regulator [Verrucomicrobiae bacterium]
MIKEASLAQKDLRVIHLEDDPLDAELIESELHTRGIPCAITRICTRDEFNAALKKEEPCDLILSDSKLPGFDTLLALTVTRQRFPKIPFIFVSGAVSPKARADALMLGASDFVGKDDLQRLTRLIHWLFSANPHKHRIPALPEVGTPVMVQCKNFRCLGYLDREGAWRDFEKSLKLADVVDWSDL